MRSRKSRLWLLTFIIASTVAIAAGISIDASSAPYNSRTAITEINYTSDPDSVSAAMTSATGMYRSVNGVDSAPIGSTVTVTWADKSKSTGTVMNLTGSYAVKPNGNPTPPSGGGGGGEGGSGGSSAGTGGNSYIGPGGCVYGCKTGTVTVGPISK